VQGGQPVEGAKTFLDSVADRYMVVSNNSTDTAARLSEKLQRIGLAIPRHRLVLAGEETIRFVAARYPAARCLIAASGLLRNMARQAGLMPVRQDAHFVILGRDLKWDYRRLTLLVNELYRGAALIATNPDLRRSDGENRIVPETGSLLAALMAAAGVQPVHTIGKPGTRLFEEALDRLRSSPQNTVVVCDHASTDQEGARRLGLRSIPVGADRGDGLPNLAHLVSA
jgi:HAD superfamily hydrolase (TIGR01450 family)